MIFTLVSSIALASALAHNQPPAPPAAKSPAEMIEQERLMATIKSLPVNRSAAGDEAQENGLLKAQILLHDQVRDMGYTPDSHEVHWSRRDDARNPKPWMNIWFELAGEDLISEVLIVAAHFDAVPTAPGADDNGSGVAALLEIARVLKDRKHHRTIKFVLFNLEENGLVGSRQYVQTMRPKWKEQGVKVVGMLSLEMLGYYDTKPGSQTNPFKGVPGLPQGELAGDFIALTTTASHAPFCAALAEAMAAAEPKVKLLKVDMFPIAPPDLLRSDHAPFMAAGIPAIMVTDTANFRNPNYHKPTDTIETLNPEYFTRTVRALAGAIDTLAGPMDKPAIEWKRQPPKPQPADDSDPSKPKTAPAPPEQPKPPAEPTKPG